ncbi:MAG TPA: twin-arginine translocase TatA/TatE family subunit [Solirubrobacteraceae bacterium]|jgi:TatA/E family protein of Tat protein translocase
MGLDNPLHIAFIVVLVLLVFGAKRLPEIGRSLGSGMREFKQAITGENHTHSTANEQQQPTLPAAAPPPPPEPAQAPPSQQAGSQDAFAQRDPAASDRS